MVAPRQRKSHVKRVYGTVVNPDDQEKKKVISHNFFMDMLRLDSFVVAFRVDTKDGVVGQDIRYDVKWNDDKTRPLDNIDAEKADEQFENANGKRKTEQRIIRDPAVKAADDPDPFRLWIVKSLKVLLRMEAVGITNQLQQIAFANNPTNSSYPVDRDQGPPAQKRETTVIKVVSNDLKGRKMRRADGTAIITDWAEYQQSLIAGEKDKDDVSLTFEFTDKFTIKFQTDKTSVVAQGVVHVLQNKEIEGLYELGDLEAKDADGKSALVRIDPLQYIVNVGTNIIAVEYEPEDE